MIKIIDNFFEKEKLEIIQDYALTKAIYSPEYFDGATIKNKENFYGNRFHLFNAPKLLELFKKQTESIFKIKIKKLNENSGIDQRNLDHFKPHVDTNMGKLNVLLMISGPTAVTNGTVFYHGTPDKYDLDVHVGFRENRAILFPSNIVHSQHVSNVPNLKRYTSTLFIKDYEYN